MANEVSITNTPLEITAAAGIRIPVVVENRPNEAVPVQVVNNAEIHGTVRVEPAPILNITPPSFLVVGRNYDVHPVFTAVAVSPANPVHLHAISYPWIQIGHAQQMGEPAPAPPVWVNTGLLLVIAPR